MTSIDRQQGFLFSFIWPTPCPTPTAKPGARAATAWKSYPTSLTAATLRDPKSPGADFPNADHPVPEGIFHLDDLSVSE